MGKRHVGLDQGDAVCDEWGVESSHRLERPRRLGPHQDPVRLERVLDSATFSEELGVGHDIELQIRPLPFDDGAQPDGRSRRDCGLLGYQDGTGRMTSDLPS